MTDEDLQVEEEEPDSAKTVEELLVELEELQHRRRELLEAVFCALRDRVAAGGWVEVAGSGVPGGA